MRSEYVDTSVDPRPGLPGGTFLRLAGQRRGIDDDQTARVGNPIGDDRWLLSRKPVVPDTTRTRLLALAHEWGCQTEDLIWRAAETSTAP
ncbi:MAG: hypothetical protein CTR55_23925 [Pseudomonas sp.]|uniref:lipocalin family protein n=1 Tax=Pseudomonas sp. TaxID=306 RepID=UPI000CC9B653|nr:lipocalin family protein [Pseudomonas sp.]PJI46633.1 MAG: hypothetical protein CTR55_23925 [Pseudomonas sp.]